jgi:hypothetical protein
MDIKMGPIDLRAYLIAVSLRYFIRSCIFTASAVLLMLVLASCRKETSLLLEPSQVLGAVLAEETARVAGTKKQVVLIVPKWAASSAVGESFKAALKKNGLHIAFTLSADMGDPMGRDLIGLKAADFFSALEKSASAGAVVSLAGAPFLNEQDAARLGSEHPPVLVVATSSLGEVMGIPGNLPYIAGLLKAKIIQLAIVDGKPEPASQVSEKRDANQQLFSQHYRILRTFD